MPRKPRKTTVASPAPPPALSYASLGPISEGTLRQEDLLAAFSSTLATLDPSPEEQNIIEQAEALLVLIDNDWFSDLEPHISPSAFLNEKLTDALQAHAAPFCHFGSHEGDGACFGFWFDTNALGEAVSDGRVLELEAGTTWKCEEYNGKKSVYMQNPNPKVSYPDWIKVPTDDDLEYIAEVSDHGNLTLFDLEGRELLSVV